MTKTAKQKEIPLTTPTRCEHWQTTQTECNCPDYRFHGGSYTLSTGVRGCKHQNELHEQEFFMMMCCSMFQTSVTPEYCGCYDWLELGECCHVDYMAKLGSPAELAAVR